MADQDPPPPPATKTEALVAALQQELGKDLEGFYALKVVGKDGSHVSFGLVHRPLLFRVGKDVKEDNSRPDVRVRIGEDALLKLAAHPKSIGPRELPRLLAGGLKVQGMGKLMKVARTLQSTKSKLGPLRAKL